MRHDGTVDWWCAPELDSPPLLWGLLDPQGALGTWSGAVAEGRTSTVAGPGLRTTVAFPHGDGATEYVHVQLLDGLVHADGACLLVRLVRSVDRSCEVEHRLRLGGFDQPTVEWTDGAFDDEPLVGTIGDRTLTLGGSGRSRLVAGEVRTAVHATPGQWHGVVVSVAEEPGRAIPSLPATADLAVTVEAAITSATEFEATCALPHHHPELGVGP